MKFEIAKFIYIFLKNCSTSSFDNYFILTKKTHLHPTRFANYDQLAIPFFKTNRVQISIKYTASLIWNSIPLELRLQSFNKCKKNCKNFLLNLYKKKKNNNNNNNNNKNNNNDDIYRPVLWYSN